MAERVIHILRAGRALCSLEGAPHNWPEGHRWIGFDDYPKEVGKHSFCHGCEDAYEELVPSTA